MTGGNGGLAIGLGVGGTLLLCCALCYCCYRKRQKDMMGDPEGGYHKQSLLV